VIEGVDLNGHAEKDALAAAAFAHGSFGNHWHLPEDATRSIEARGVEEDPPLL
jgi:hypothetical protein